ncbi:MAG: hypothetical protein JNM85_02715 [Chthonomonas sp.]|nr:hypothetical protein [Chthonomonas sp.]
MADSVRPGLAVVTTVLALIRLMNPVASLQLSVVDDGVFVTLKNESTSVLRLWPADSIFGEKCVVYEARQASGSIRTWRPTPAPRAAAPVLRCVELDPGASRQVGRRSIAEIVRETGLGSGEWDLRAVYQNRIEAMDDLSGVWTGYVESPWTTISATEGM